MHLHRLLDIEEMAAGGEFVYDTGYFYFFGKLGDGMIIICKTLICFAVQGYYTIRFSRHFPLCHLKNIAIALVHSSSASAI